MHAILSCSPPFVLLFVIFELVHHTSNTWFFPKKYFVLNDTCFWKIEFQNRGIFLKNFRYEAFCWKVLTKWANIHFLLDTADIVSFNFKYLLVSSLSHVGGPHTCEVRLYVRGRKHASDVWCIFSSFFTFNSDWSIPKQKFYLYIHMFILDCRSLSICLR